MKCTRGTLVAATLIVASLLPSAASASAASATKSAMRITQVTARPRTVSRTGLITFIAQVQGIRLSYKHMGQRPVAGEGHLQYYLESIPRDAWSKPDLSHTFLGAVGTPVVTFSLKTTRMKFSPGKHRILVALAKNNRVLYHAPVASVTITVK